MPDERVCRICGVDCKYPSKLKRQLQSARHQLYTATLCTNDDDDDDDDPFDVSDAHESNTLVLILYTEQNLSW